MWNAQEQEHGESQYGYIELSEMPQASKALFPEDNWTGISDPLARKKLQNRINQRSYRQRRNVKLLSQGTLPEEMAAHSTGVTLIAETAEGSRIPADEAAAHAQKAIQISMSALKQELKLAKSRKEEAIAQGLDPQAATHQFLLRTTVSDARNINSKVTFPLSADHLLTLIKYNVFRAIIANALYLDIDPGILCHKSISPFSSEDSISSQALPSLPSTLQPTDLQKIVPHHPLMDLFPVARIRDNLLSAGDTFDSEDLAADIFDTGLSSKGVERSGLIVWGEPWHPGSWEVSEGFARKWPWILEGCSEILETTDFWREKRGEPRLKEVL